MQLKMLNLLDVFALSTWKPELDKIKSYEIECKEEVEKLRKKFICEDRNVTFADLLTKNVRKVAVYLGLSDVKKRINKVNFSEEFPIYSSMLKFRISKGKDLACLISKAYKSLQILLKDPRIPHTFLMTELNYLTENDLRILSTIQS